MPKCGRCKRVSPSRRRKRCNRLKARDLLWQRVLAENQTFKKNEASFKQGWDNAVFSVEGIPSLYEAMAIEKKPGKTTTQDIFKLQALTKAKWENMYQGSGTVGAIDGFESLIY